MTVNDADQPREAVLHTDTWATPQDRMGYQPLSAYQLERLHADLHRARVAKRDQGGRSLSYLEAYDVKATLIRIFGYGNFSVEVTDTNVVHTSTYQNNGRDLWRIAAIATVRLTLHQTGAVYMESAAASQSGPDIGEVMDFAIKTAESDALKRCAIYLGSTFGLSLYNDGSTEDVVRFVYSPDQKDLIDDLRVARTPGPEGEAARTRMQARLKTHEKPADIAVQVQLAADAAQAPTDTPTDTPEGRPAAARRKPQVVPAAAEVAS